MAKSDVCICVPPRVCASLPTCVCVPAPPTLRTSFINTRKRYAQIHTDGQIRKREIQSDRPTDILPLSLSLLPPCTLWHTNSLLDVHGVASVVVVGVLGSILGDQVLHVLGHRASVVGGVLALVAAQLLDELRQDAFDADELGSHQPVVVVAHVQNHLHHLVALPLVSVAVRTAHHFVADTTHLVRWFHPLVASVDDALVVLCRHYALVALPLLLLVLAAAGVVSHVLRQRRPHRFYDDALHLLLPLVGWEIGGVAIDLSAVVKGMNDGDRRPRHQHEEGKDGVMCPRHHGGRRSTGQILESGLIERER
mmetsp:Transcript_48299/g.120902  ORF Transcript_48299/g.120902 Transcript_48299/m.120902 type:complete len:309 (-) Transcript_48299:222-1148(-)